MGRNVKVNVEYLTRVEGHGNIVVNVTDGRLEECRLDIVEAPRFFEGLLRGRSIFEAQHITSRICGICAVGHTLASIRAAEDAIGFLPSEQTVLLRKVMLHLELLDSHILHIYLLVAPDLLGVDSFVPLIDTHNSVVRRALRMKKTVNDVCTLLAGRHVHPITTIVGGFTRLPTGKVLEDIRKMLVGLEGDMAETVQLLSSLEFPDFHRETEYVALVADGDEYPLLDGDVGSSDGVRLGRHRYREITNEFVVPHSSAKFTRLSRESYTVGALARFNLNAEKLHKEAKAVASLFGLKPPVTNPYLNTVAQLVECVHCYHDCLALVDELMERGINKSEEVTIGLNEQGHIPVRAGEGVGAVEVPRGVLFHNYTVDDSGVITSANCIIPTNQNVNNMEHDMRKLVPEILDLSDAEITRRLEMLIRAYDPCISCSAHFLKVRYRGERHGAV